MKLKISILTFLISIMGFSQKPINQLVKDYSTTKELEYKKELSLKIIDYYQKTKKNNDSIIKYLNSPIPIKKDSLYYAELLYRRAKYNNANSSFDLGLKNSEKSAALFENYDENYKRAKAKSLQGTIYQAMFKNQLALSSYDEAKAILEGIDRVHLLTGYASVYSQLGDLDKSIDFYNQAYKLSVDNNYDNSLFNIHNGMAVVYFNNNNPEKSIESLKKALEEAKKRDYLLGQVVCLHNLGHKYQIEEEYITAISYFEEGIALLDKIDYKLLEGQIFYKYADCLLILGDITKASVYANKSEIIFKEMESTGRLPFALRTQASIQKQKGKTKEAIAILENALQISSNNEISSITSDLYLKLAENYKDLENANKTYEAYNNHIRIKDSLANRIKSTEIEKVKAKFESSERENKLKLDNELLEAKNKTSYYRNILLVFALLGAIFFFYRQRRISKAKQKALKQEKEIIALNEELLKDKVKHKNTQITEYAILIDERNKFLDTIKSQIKDIRDLSNDNNQKRKINDLQYFIKENISVNKEKVDLDKNIDKPEEQFRFNLEQRFPKLTEKEIIVCRLLLLNLSSKQIAQKMEITVQSVNNYRASIRKKINLEKGVNLKRFLKQI